MPSVNIVKNTQEVPASRKSKQGKIAGLPASKPGKYQAVRKWAPKQAQTPEQSKQAVSVPVESTTLESQYSYTFGEDAHTKQIDQSNIPSSTVWVGNVCRKVTKEEFQDVFQRFGPVVLIRLFRRSKCAFVTFRYARDAVKSLELEGEQLGSMDLTLNVGKASRHLWVGNVENNVSPLRLRNMFEQYGDIESVRTLPVNKSAFINFHLVSDAVRATEALNGVILGNKKIVINYQWPAIVKKNKTQPNFVAWNPVPDSDDAPILQAFSKGARTIATGSVSSPSIVSIASSNGELSPHAREFHPSGSEESQSEDLSESESEDESEDESESESESESEDEDEELEPETRHEEKTASNIAFSPVVEQTSRPAPEPKKFILIRKDEGKTTPASAIEKNQHATASRQLFVGNIEPSVSEDTIRTLFERFGQVASIRSYIPRGYCFVTYERTKVAVWVREQMTLYPPVLGNRPLAVNFGRQPQGNNKGRQGYEVHVHEKIRSSRFSRKGGESSSSGSDSAASTASNNRWVFVKLDQ